MTEQELARQGLKQFIGSFGGGQPMANGYVLLWAEDRMDARRLMVERYDRQWCDVYPGEIGKKHVTEYGWKLVAVIDSDNPTVVESVREYPPELRKRLSVGGLRLRDFMNGPEYTYTYYFESYRIPLHILWTCEILPIVQYIEKHHPNATITVNLQYASSTLEISWA
jgi:hypothetical protein